MSLHILPINDKYIHKESTDCPCLPDVEPETETEEELVIHHSFDGRELAEGEEAARNYLRVLQVRRLIMENAANQTHDTIQHL